ncbi:MAG: hypothetical protein JNJ56_13975, partial [Ignavibacteria bacterium]|nr:hypothetical protein [Ignavibacteria bacterium]
AVKRRLKVLSEDNLIDYKDLPLNKVYSDGIKNLKIELIAESRWINGVSAYLTKSQFEKLKELEYVDNVYCVNKLYKQN